MRTILFEPLLVAMFLNLIVFMILIDYADFCPLLQARLTTQTVPKRTASETATPTTEFNVFFVSMIFIF
jgi:hypothetical protein